MTAAMSQTTTQLGDLIDGRAASDRLIAAGLSQAEAAAKAERFGRAAAHLLTIGHAPDAAAVAAFVPGRIEVMGKHTDYCGGRSLLCTVERGMCFVAIARGDADVTFTALDLDDTVRMTLSGDTQPRGGHWSNYPANVVRRIARNFADARTGADVAMSSDLPKASGLSSSSAMIVGTFLVLARVNGLETTETYRRHLPDREAMAGYLGTIENGQSFGPLAGDRGVGTFGGSQDHTAILCCRPGQLSVYSFCPVRHERDVRLPAGVRFVVADSGVAAEKTGNAQARYNRVSARARELVSHWNEAGGHAACLHDVLGDGADPLGRLRQLLRARGEAERQDLSSRLDQFLIESNNLIPKAADAIASGDLTVLRWILDESQARAETHLRNQVPETVALQRAMVAGGAIAASAFGAGFGGSVWGLFDDAGLAAWQASATAANHAWFTTRPGCAAFVFDRETA